MVKLRRFNWTVFLVLGIVILGLFLRHYNYRTLPRHGATFDEFAWTWLGINLIQKHVPISWSPQPQYKERQEIKYQGARFLIVKPYLEHPPLFGIVAGGFALLNGTKNMYDVTLAKIRPLSLILGVFSIIMIFLLANEVYGKQVALLTSLIYATVPTIVIGSRIVQNENFVIPFWLLSLYLISRYLKTGKKRLRNTAAVLAGLLSLAKVPWLVVGLSLSMILSFNGKWKDAFFLGGVTIIIFSIYIFYGLYFDKDLFINLLKLQTARYDISFAGLFSVFTNPLLVDRYFLDGWILFGWLSIVLTLRDFKKHFLIAIPFIAYLLIYAFAIPNEPSHGWYRYPFSPFLIISTSIILVEEMKKISLVSLLFILIVGLTLLDITWQQNFGFSYPVYRSFIIAGALSVGLGLWKIGKLQNLKFPITFTWIIIFIVLNIWAILTYIE
jgi:4-amino-4-deoxy-L-arabinose transferase-like glycosyltransferase